MGSPARSSALSRGCAAISRAAMSAWCRVSATFGPYAAMVLAAYPVADYGGDATMTYIALSSDVKFVCQARRSARAAVAKAAAPVFRYHFTYDGYTTLPNDTPLAFHGLDLIYIFRNWEAVLDGNFEYQPNADDLAMAATIFSISAACSSFLRRLGGCRRWKAPASSITSIALSGI